jgi:hypothetical protein
MTPFTAYFKSTTLVMASSGGRAVEGLSERKSSQEEIEIPPRSANNKNIFVFILYQF